MSKIQQALQKLQSSGSSARKSKPSAGGASKESIDRASDDVLEDTRVNMALKNNDIVVIDLESLRDEGLVPQLGQKDEVENQYRQIKRPVVKYALNVDPDENVVGKNLVVVTSALPGDGKTFSSINLANSVAAEEDVTALLIDADVHKCKLSKVLGIEESPGLLDLLLDKNLDISDVIRPTSEKGLSVLSAGRWDAHATELFASRRMKHIARELSRRLPNRIVIFDSPPLLATSEGPVLASVVGQIVMIVNSGKTAKSTLPAAMELLDPNKPIGVVLNRVPPRAAGFYDYYGYSAGRGQGSLEPGGRV